MGSGKTTYLKEYINEEYQAFGIKNKYLFITPYLKQIEHIEEDEEGNTISKSGIIHDCSNANFKQPKHLGTGKLESLHNLILDNENIAITHALFSYASKETYELLKINEYIIIIDEVLQLIDTIAISLSDYKMLINDKIKVNEYGELVWLDNNYIGKFSYLKNLCENGLVIESMIKPPKKKKSDDEILLEEEKAPVQLLVWNFNPRIFKDYSNEIYILTYLFEGSYMYLYFKTHNIEYDKYTIYNQIIIPYTNIKEDKTHIRKLINIYEGKLNNIGDNKTALSKSWFKNSNNRLLIKQLQKNINNYFRNMNKVKSTDLMWTTFKDYQHKLKGKGYSNSFIQCAEKGSNEYGNIHYIAYCCNRFFNPDDITYFSKFQVEVNEDIWALSEMIQFIWRSAIRNNEEIHLYIPSKRMRDLLIYWLEN